MITTGTGMASRKEMPEILKMNKMGKIRQGAMLPFKNNGKLSLDWRENIQSYYQYFSYRKQK
jgi:hypothetical protein